jgi:hypothetical protein
MLSFGASAIGLIIVLVYWFQSNLMLGNFVRTDGKHALLSAFHPLFAILLRRAGDTRFRGRRRSIA